MKWGPQSFSLVIFLTVCLGCTHYEPPHGTQHSGGGATTQSSPEEVKRALDQALIMATEPAFDKNIFAQFVSDRRMSKKGRIFERPVHIFPNDPATAKPEQAYKSQSLEALKTNPMDRISSGDCPHGPGENHADASVSELSLNARLCISVGNLTKLPRSILLREILALLLHEACHMGGANESEARTYQAEFTEYFSSRFGDITIDDFTYQTKSILNDSARRLSAAKGAAAFNPASVQVYAQMGSVIGALRSIPHINDPLAIELKALPAHPEHIENFWVLANLLIQKMSTAFEEPDLIRVPTLVAYRGRLVDAEDVTSNIAEYQKGLECLRENFSALTSGVLRKECILKPLNSFEKMMLLPRDPGH